MLLNPAIYRTGLFVFLFIFLQNVLFTLNFVSGILPQQAFGESSPEKVSTVKPEATPAYITLNNGMEFMLIENHSNPMIASVIVVKTGSRNEDLSNNGVSHMLEHLLFNGTENRTQEQIYDQMDFCGGYNNAHTAKDFTNFMILIPAEHIEKGLDIQADMLFNSTIPEGKLEKEKGIVIEEIGKDMDEDGYTNRLFFDRKLYQGTPYALPVMGSVNSIMGMARSDIFSYYKKYYVPNNMIGMIIGDFDTASMVKKLKRLFEVYPPRTLPFSRKLRLKSLEHNNFYRIKEDVKKRYLSLGIKAPAIENPDFFPFTILNTFLNNYDSLKPDNYTEEKNEKIKDPDISQVYSEYISSRDTGVLNIHSTLSPNADCSDAVHAVILNLQSLANKLNISHEDLKGIKTQIKTEESFLKERMHYYGISNAHFLANAGYQFMESYINNIERVTLKDVKKIARKYLAIDTALFSRRTGKSENINYTATVVEPLENHEEASHLDGYLHHGEKPNGSIADKEVANVNKEILPNGLTLITNENSDSKVFAVHVLFKNRSFNEPDDKTGIVDFLHHLLLKGTASKSEKDIEKALNSIGVRLSLFDDPSMPYDNYRTSSQYSFIRLETIDDFYDQSLILLADIITNPKFDVESVEQVRGDMLNIIREEESRVSKIGESIFYENLFQGISMSKRISGTVETVSNITEGDLTAFHKRYFSPDNMIINIVSNVSSADVKDKVKELFGGLKQAEWLKQTEQIKPEAIKDVKTVTVKRGKEQSYIYFGYPIPHVEEFDEAPIVILSSIMSSDMAFRLREKQGLAYSIECSIQTLHDFGWFQASLGARGKNIEHVRNEIIDLIKEYQAKEFDQNEVEKAINKLRGKMMMRRLPRINQAYYAGLFEFYKGNYDYDKNLLNMLNMVTTDDLKRVAVRYLDYQNYLWLVVE